MQYIYSDCKTLEDDVNQYNFITLSMYLSRDLSLDWGLCVLVPNK